jgi:sulfite reductase alpha subunit-like flavoprotein
MAEVLVLYGSQTGTAEDVAESVGRALTRHYVANRVVAMDDYNISELVNQSTALFVCSTTGQGETPDNMRKFWRFLLQKRLPLSSLAALRFSCFGLGDTSYPKFNFVAKKLSKRLQQLGGSMIADLGLADDQHALGVEGALIPWLQHVLTAVHLLWPPIQLPTHSCLDRSSSSTPFQLVGLPCRPPRCSHPSSESQRQTPNLQ